MKGLYTIKLLLVFVVVVAITRNQPTKEENTPPELAGSGVIIADSSIVLDELAISLDEVMSVNRWSRNPFLPYNNLYSEHANNEYGSVDSGMPRIERIFRDSGKYKVQISNSVMQEGDRFLNMTVAYIGESIVIFSREDDEYAALSWRPLK